MTTTTEINAIIDQAKQQRADYIADKVQGAVVPIALATIVSLVLFAFPGSSTHDQAQPSPVEASAQLG